MLHVFAAYNILTGPTVNVFADWIYSQRLSDEAFTEKQLDGIYDVAELNPIVIKNFWLFQSSRIQRTLSGSRIQT